MLEEEGTCNTANLLAALQDKIDTSSPPCPNSAEDELVALLNAVDIADVDELIKHACQMWFDHESNEEYLKYDAKTYAFLKEYFDGGTYWNEDRETLLESGDGTATKVLKDDVSGIKGIYEDVAQTGGIEFPYKMENYQDCTVGAAMCCWIQDRQAKDDNGNCDTPYDTNCLDSDPADNTDICYVDMGRDVRSNYVPTGYAIFAKENEGDTHCHGFAWGEDKTAHDHRYRGNNLFYVSMYDHLYTRGT